MVVYTFLKSCLLLQLNFLNIICAAYVYSNACYKLRYGGEKLNNLMTTSKGKKDS